jgi:hypothetical protein
MLPTLLCGKSTRSSYRLNQPPPSTGTSMQQPLKSKIETIILNISLTLVIVAIPIGLVLIWYNIVQ